MNRKKFLASFLAAATILTAGVNPVFAAGTQNVSSGSNASVAVSGSVTPKNSSVISVTVPTQMSFVLDFTKDNPLITSPAAITNNSTKAVNIVLKSMKANNDTKAKVIAHDKYTDSEWNALGTDDSESQIALGLNDGSSDYWFNAETDDSSNKASFTIDSDKSKDVSIIAKYGKAWKNAAELNYSMVLGVSLKNSSDSGDSSGSTATDESWFITKDNGDGTCEVTGFERTANIPNVVIPSTISGKKVISLGSLNNVGIFQGNENVKTVVIPDSVTSIGDCAFFGCSSLTSINIPNSVTSIGPFAFEKCASLTSINIPNSVTSIGNYAFYYCASLTSINIPNSVTSIGDYAFSDCRSLTSIDIPDSVTSMGEDVFDGWTSSQAIYIHGMNYKKWNSNWLDRGDCKANIEYVE